MSKGADMPGQIPRDASSRSSAPGVGRLIGPRILVLPGQVWKDELTAELMRLGIDGGEASRSATHVLHRVCGHHSWPRASYLFDAEDDRS